MCKTNRNSNQTTSTSMHSPVTSSQITTTDSLDDHYLSEPKKIMEFLTPNSSPSFSTRKSKNLKNLQLNLSNAKSPRNNTDQNYHSHNNSINSITYSSDINNIEIPNTAIPYPHQKSENWVSSSSFPLGSNTTLKTPTNTSTTIAHLTQPRPLQHFRRMTSNSFNSGSPSQSSVGSTNNSGHNKSDSSSNDSIINNNSSSSNGNTTINNETIAKQRKRSTTNLAINIPVKDIPVIHDETIDGSTVIPITHVDPKTSNNYGDFLTNATAALDYADNQLEQQNKLNNKKIPILPFEKPQRRMDSIDFTTSNGTLSSSPVSFSSPSMSISAKPLSPSFSSPGEINYSSEIKPQTIIHSFDGSKTDESNIENYKMAYPNGPVCVLEPNLYLYSEPTFEEVLNFDVIINVAQEIKDFTKQVNELNNELQELSDFENISIDSSKGKDKKMTFTNRSNKKNIEYYFIPWTHTSRLTSDFPYLTTLIDQSLKKSKKVLIHCQCGVSRSASLIMAYFMKVFGGGYNDAYNRLKKIVPQISPNLSLIYELIEWGESLEKGQLDQ